MNSASSKLHSNQLRKVFALPPKLSTAPERSIEEVMKLMEKPEIDSMQIIEHIKQIAKTTSSDDTLKRLIKALVGDENFGETVTSINNSKIDIYDNDTALKHFTNTRGGKLLKAIDSQQETSFLKKIVGFVLEQPLFKSGINNISDLNLEKEYSGSIVSTVLNDQFEFGEDSDDEDPTLGPEKKWGPLEIQTVDNVDKRANGLSDLPAEVIINIVLFINPRNSINIIKITVLCKYFHLITKSKDLGEDVTKTYLRLFNEPKRISGLKAFEVIHRMSENIKAALKTVKLIQDDRYKAIALSDIATEQAKIDLDWAKTTFREAIDAALMADKKYQDKDLSYIAVAQAKNDLEGAIITTNLIENDLTKKEALLGIAQERAKKGALKGAFETVKSIKMPDRVLLHIATEQAKSDPEGAIKTANLIGNDTYKDMTLVEIAIVHAKNNNIEGAIKIAELIQNKRSSDKTEALLYIAKEQAKIDRTGAKTTFRKAIKAARLIYDAWQKEIALLFVDKEEAKVDYQATEQAIALFYVVKEQAKIDIEDAIETTKLIQDARYKAEALLCIGKEQAITHHIAKEQAHFPHIDKEPENSRRRGAKKSFREAVKAARLIQDTYIKTLVLAKIAKEQANIDPKSAKITFEEAINTVKLIKLIKHISRSPQFARQKPCLLSDIAVAQAKSDLNRAETTFKKAIDATNLMQYYGLDRTAVPDTLCYIAKNQAKIDIDWAKATIKLAVDAAAALLDRFDNGKALLIVAKAQAEIDLEEGETSFKETIKIAMSIQDDVFRDKALFMIAMQQAKIDLGFNRTVLETKPRLSPPRLK